MAPSRQTSSEPVPMLKKKREHTVSDRTGNMSALKKMAPLTSIIKVVDGSSPADASLHDYATD